MDAEKFRKTGKEMVDLIADYLGTVHSRPVSPSVKPGFLINQLPATAPEEGQNWDEIAGDIEKYIMPGVMHWNSPHFHAYYPASSSYPSILGDMLSAAIGGVGFSWAAQPASTELEIVVMDWLGKMIGLPQHFLASSGKQAEGKRGGGVIQSSASDSLLITMLAARSHALEELMCNHPGQERAGLISKLVCYASDQVHSSFEKAAVISVVQFRHLETDEKGALRGDCLEMAIKADKEKGFHPFYVCATLGTTSSGAFDNLTEVGKV